MPPLAWPGTASGHHGKNRSTRDALSSVSATRSDQGLAHEDAAVSGLLEAGVFGVAEVRVERAVLVHQRMGVELDLAIATAPRLLLGVAHQATAEPPALVRGVDSDVVE